MLTDALFTYDTTVFDAPVHKASPTPMFVVYFLLHHHHILTGQSH